MAESAIIEASMPSPIGHLLAGVAAAWAVDLIPGDRVFRAAPAGASWWERAGGGLTAACAALAAAPDLDLVAGIHRMATHSVTAALLVAVAAGLIARGRGRPALRVGLMCGAAYATHLLLDLVAVDQTPPKGIELLWPFSHRWVITNWQVFLPTERRNLLSAYAVLRNVRAGVRELAIMTPVLIALWLVSCNRGS
jgi:membrane-bound metal-dependent hydrolase YbcI (DUF457 family)